MPDQNHAEADGAISTLHRIQRELKIWRSFASQDGEIMADKETFQKEMRAKLRQWSRIIDELRASGEEKVMSHRRISNSKDFIAYCNNGNMLLNKYSEAKQKLDELAKIEHGKWEEPAADIEVIMGQLDHLLETLLSIH